MKNVETFQTEKHLRDMLIVCYLINDPEMSMIFLHSRGGEPTQQLISVCLCGSTTDMTSLVFVHVFACVKLSHLRATAK